MNALGRSTTLPSRGEACPAGEISFVATRGGDSQPVVDGIVFDPQRLTELEAGSYVFMDTAYFAVGGKTDEKVYTDFNGALTIITTIDSKRHPKMATIDYGNKAMLRPTDKVKGMPWIKVSPQGAEYGALSWNDGDRDLKVGERVELYCTNLDTSTNCYDRYYVAKGDQIVDVWPIMGRGGAAQR